MLQRSTSQNAGQLPPPRPASRHRNRIVVALLVLGAIIAAPVLFLLALSSANAAR